VAQANKDKRSAQLHGLRSEQELHREVQAIERAARQAVAEDRDAYAGMFLQVSGCVYVYVYVYICMHAYASMDG
jgi:hypothetical protein